MTLSSVTNKARSSVKSGALAGWLPAAFRVDAWRERLNRCRTWIYCHLGEHNDGPPQTERIMRGETIIGHRVTVCCKDCGNILSWRVDL